MIPPQRTNDLRRLNRKAVLRSLYLDGPGSRVYLSRRTGLSAASVTNITTDLIAEGMIHETGWLEPIGGRPAAVLAINPEHGCLVGVDLGETQVQMELFDLSLGKLITVRHLLNPTENSPDQYADHIARGLDELLHGTGLDGSCLLGLGVGVPGVVERSGSVCVSAPMWDWNPVPLLDLIAPRIPVPVFMDNGAKAMTLAEAWFGAGRGVKDLVVALIGNGIGAGLFAGGAVYRGASNSAGEWGHTRIMLDGRPCRCGSRGCLEAYAGAHGIRETLLEVDPDHQLLDLEVEIAFMGGLASASRQGDPAAQAVLRATAQALGIGLANLVNLLNPEKILLGGWVGMQLGPELLRALPEFVEPACLPTARKDLKIDLCQFGQDAISVGAACLVLEELLSAA